MKFSCSPYLETRCASCTLLGGDESLYFSKFKALESAFYKKFPDAKFQAPETLSTPFKSRSKAKLQVGGSIVDPQIGLVKRDGKKFFISQLTDCPLHTEKINPVLVDFQHLITKHSLAPYNIEKRSGELKGIIILEASSGIGVRFVSKSKSLETRFRNAAADLVALHPEIVSVSLNIQPIPNQIVEGEEEHLLFGVDCLTQEYRDFFVTLPAQSFVQVTPEIAKSLYATALSWLSDRTDREVLDLFCGAGGFLLSVAPLCKRGVGIEIRKQAVDCANESARKLGFTQLEFIEGDLLLPLLKGNFDTVIVNPPRRGLGRELCEKLKELSPRQILYSSCNSETMLSDIEMLGYKPIRVQGFDMFPLTEHLEVLALLELN
jgi:23S rRNA (uracil747-C5)-methyltransferase